MSLFAQIAEHQFCETVILIAFRDLSLEKIHKEIVMEKRKFTLSLLRLYHHGRMHACYIRCKCKCPDHDHRSSSSCIYIHICIRITYYVYMYMYIYIIMSQLGASEIIFGPLSCCGSLCRTRGSQAW